MKRSDKADRHETPALMPAPYDVEVEGLHLRVRHGWKGPPYSAEISVLDGDWESAIVDAPTREELLELVAAAVPAFAASVRLRRLPRRP